MAGKRWNRSELVVALRLYFMTPFGRLHKGNSDIIRLAKRLERTPSSVAMKLVNFAACDPNLPQRGLSNASRLDREVFNEFLKSADELLFEAELDFPGFFDSQVADSSSGSDCDSTESLRVREGIDQPTETTFRVGQEFFRRAVLANFSKRCAMVDLSHDQLLIASHIIPWKDDPERRCDPSNGLLLTALHDRAFDRGLISVDPDDKRVLISEALKDHCGTKEGGGMFLKEAILELEGRRIRMPGNVSISKEALDYHNKTIFLK